MIELITIVDYGMGNVGSIKNMFRRVGVKAEISGDPARIEQATKLVLPGVGHFDKAMRKIGELRLRSVLDRKALQDKVPVLGICLGMQLLTRGSEEGSLPGLAWIDGETRRFPSDLGVKIPHMGWNMVRASKDDDLLSGLEADHRFYFVHSYFVEADHERDVLLKATYGLDFDAAIAKENIMGAQFHPEKSHRYGMRLLHNFARI